MTWIIIQSILDVLLVCGLALFFEAYYVIDKKIRVLVFTQLHSQLEWYEMMGMKAEAIRLKNIILSDPQVGEVYRAEAKEFNEYARAQGKADRIHIDGIPDSPDTPR